MNARDETLLRDMLDMAQKARQFLGELPRESLADEELVAYAVVRTLEILGEAASHVSSETRAVLPDIPWYVMVGMRNRIVHDYTHVDYRIVWDTVTADLPPLVEALTRILGSRDTSEGTSDDEKRTSEEN